MANKSDFASTVDFNSGLIDFIQASPTPYHAVNTLSAALKAAGFLSLNESKPWKLKKRQGYFATRGGSSIIAFKTGNDDLASTGVRMVGAHTDSPCLKIKPQPEIHRYRYAQLGVEVYGGVLLNPWFDRDLSIAGRIDYREKSGKLSHCLINFEKAIAVIPSLAIHLDREANENRKINAQTDIIPIVTQLGKDGSIDLKGILLEHLRSTMKLNTAEKVLAYDLRLYDVQPPALTGMHEEFIAGARLDNLLSCYVGLQSLLHSNDKHASLLICTDHEEVGSISANGAKGPFLESVLERIAETLATASAESKRHILENSIMFSVDNAHGIHPNFPGKHDDKHGPLLNAGPVIKINANQRYATSSETSAFFRQLCEDSHVPIQAFVVRNDMGCGSTIGPIVAGELGVKTLDIGVPTFAMHSIREMAGAKDTVYLASALTAFYNR